MDEPDVFLDFENLNGLRDLINGYKGTLLVVTHSRYLLAHCFDKIWHLENGDLQEFDGSFAEYNCSRLQKKIDLQLADWQTKRRSSGSPNWWNGCGRMPLRSSTPVLAAR